MNIKNHFFRQVSFFLLSAAAGALSVADKHYELFYLCAPALAAGAAVPPLSRHGIMLGQLSCLFFAGEGKRLLPLLILIYFLRPLFRRKKQPHKKMPSGVLAAVVILYEIGYAWMVRHDSAELLLGLCEGILSGCALFFSEYIKEDPPRSPLKGIQLCNLLIVSQLLLMLADDRMTDGFLLHLTALLVILFWGRFPSWQCVAGVCLTAVDAALIGGELSALPLYLSAAAAVSIMARFGKKRYTSAMLLCCYLALLPTGLWLERLLWLTEPFAAAVIFWLLPLKETAPVIPPQDLSQQYRELVEQVDKLQQTAGRRIAFYPEIAAKAAELLRREGMRAINVTCAKDLLGGFFLDVSYQKGDTPLPPTALLGLLERSCGFALASSRYHEKNGEVYACFVRRPPYTVQCAALCKTKEGEKVCGDSAIAFSCDQNHYVLLLSDGMGSGKDAFAQSRWTVTLLQKLLRSGMRAEGAIGMVHSSLKLAQEDIAFATADLCTINLQNGQAKFIKAGAVSTFILRDSQIIEVCGISMPLGASETPDVAAKGTQLCPEDLIMLISDGACERKDEILYTLQKYRALPLPKLCRLLLDSALPPDSKEAEDDITVLIAKFCKNE